MKFYVFVIFIFIYGCSSSVPNEYALQIESLKGELIKTKAKAEDAIQQISKLEKKLSKKITITDSLIVEHKKETLLLRASDAFQKGNYALITKKYKNAIKHCKKTMRTIYTKMVQSYILTLQKKTYNELIYIHTMS